MTAISDKYLSLGGLTSFLGAPVSGEVAAAKGGVKQEFQHGSIYWHPSVGAFEVHGLIRERWLMLGAEASFLGYPLSDEAPARNGFGRFNTFEGGAIFWHPSIGAFEVHGRIRQRWMELGGVWSELGFPTTNESTTPDGIGRYNHFQNGSIYWTPSTGAHEVTGLIRERWAELRWERGHLGYPTAPPFDVERDRTPYRVARFQNGKIELNLHTQYVHVEKTASATSPNFSIPIVAFRAADKEGGRPCTINADEVRQWVEEANRVFAAAGMVFTYDGVIHDLWDTDVNSVAFEGDVHWNVARDTLNDLAKERKSIIVVFRFGPDPIKRGGGGFSWWTYDFVAMSYFDPNAIELLAHELGHYFGLPHTFGSIFKTVREASDHILSRQPVSAFDGDSFVIDDTPLDPFIEELKFVTAVQAVTLGGQTFALARPNIMSYWHHGETKRLSHSQITRVRQILQERRSRFLSTTGLPAITCTDLNDQISLHQKRLDELFEERQVETVPSLQRRLDAAIEKIRNEITQLSNQAQQLGCD
jgi:hypothetical protein